MYIISEMTAWIGEYEQQVTNEWLVEAVKIRQCWALLTNGDSFSRFGTTVKYCIHYLKGINNDSFCALSVWQILCHTTDLGPRSIWVNIAAIL